MALVPCVVLMNGVIPDLDSVEDVDGVPIPPRGARVVLNGACYGQTGPFYAEDENRNTYQLKGNNWRKVE